MHTLAAVCAPKIALAVRAAGCRRAAGWHGLAPEHKLRDFLAQILKTSCCMLLAVCSNPISGKQLDQRADQWGGSWGPGFWEEGAGRLCPTWIVSCLDADWAGSRPGSPGNPQALLCIALMLLVSE